MKNIFLLTLCLICSSTLFAQNNKTQSAKQNIKNLEQELKMQKQLLKEQAKNEQELKQQKEDSIKYADVKTKDLDYNDKQVSKILKDSKRNNLNLFKQNKPAITKIDEIDSLASFCGKLSENVQKTAQDINEGVISLDDQKTKLKNTYNMFAEALQLQEIAKQKRLNVKFFKKAEADASLEYSGLLIDTSKNELKNLLKLVNYKTKKAAL